MSALPAADPERQRLLAAYLREREQAPAPAPDIPRRPAGRAMPLSWMQQQIWLHARLAGRAPVYNEPVTIHRRGPLDVGALERAFAEILRRHEAWRTSFREVDGGLVQVVAPAPEVTFPVADLRGLPPSEREAAALHLATEDALPPFDLARGPLWRGRLVRLADDEHRLFVTLHHIIFDGVSMYRVFLPELTTLYEAFAAGAPSPLPEPPVQYPDFAGWHRDWLTGVAERQLAYWRQAMAGASALELQTDRPRDPRPRFEGEMQPLSLGPRLSEALRRLSRAEGVTLFMTTLAAFVALLARYSGQGDVTVGTVTAGRKRPEVERLLGYFLNPLAIRADVADDPTFRTLLGRVRTATLEALANDDVPFEQVVRAVHGQRDPARNPLFQVMFSMEPPLPALPPGWRFTQLDVETGSAKFDLYLELDERVDGIIGRFTYRTDLFERDTVARMSAHYVRLLDAVVNDPGRPISALPLLSEAERSQLLAWGDRRTAYPETATIHELVAGHAARTPDAPAVIAGDTTLTYAELDRRANQLGHRLRALGVGPDVPVAVALERSPEMVVAFLGVLKAGGAYVPLDPGYPPALLALMVKDVGVSAIVTASSLYESVPVGAVPVITLDTERLALEAEPTAAPMVVVGARHLAYILFTSGSTGRPKGVAVEHRSVVRLVFGQDYTRFAPDEVFGQTGAVTFDATTFELWGALLHGGRCALLPGRVPTPALLSDLCRRQGVTTLWLTSSVFNHVIETAPDALRGLRRLLVGGEALSVPHVRRAQAMLEGTQIVNGYGPTECTVFACCHPLPGPLPADASSVPMGPPIANTEAYVVDRNLALVPVGVPGELLLGGPGLARGYVNRADLTGRQFIAHPFRPGTGERVYRTGDRVRWRPDGTLQFLGRLDDQVKVRGFRVEPGEVERALAGHPLVREAAVAAVPDTHGDRQLVGYVVARNGTPPRPGELRRFLSSSLAPHMVPTAFVTLDALPLTPSGKVDRPRLPAPVRSAGDGEGGTVAPRDMVQAQLVELWQDLLDVRPIGIRDDFFDLGGHSLIAARMIDQLAAFSGTTLPLTTLYTNPTIEALADVVRSGGPEPGAVAAPVTLNESGRRRPLVVFHGDLSGGGLYCVRLARRLGADVPVHVLHPHTADGPPPVTVDSMADQQLQTLRRLQPRGPYRLAGYCNGGVVAYEVARRLVAAGERVELLALIAVEADTRWRAFHTLLSRLTPGSNWFGRLRTFVMTLEGARLGERAARSARKVAEVAMRRRRGRETTYDRFLRAVMGWVPGSYPGRLVVVWPADAPSRRPGDPTHGWQRLVPQVDVHLVPGDHTSVLSRHVDAVADRLAAYL